MNLSSMWRPPGKPAPSILLTQVLSYLVIILVITVTFSLLFFSTAKSHLEQEIGRKLQDIAGISARSAPFERLDLIKVGDDQTRMVLRLKEKIAEIRETTGVENIVIFRLLDRASLVDLRPGHPIGTAYDMAHFKKPFLDRLMKGVPVNTGSYRLTGGSIYISAYAPIMSQQGRLFAIVAVDAGTREIEVIERLRFRLYLIAAIGMILASILAFLLASKLTKPIRQMAETAESIGKGEYSSRVPLSSIAELGVLARAINEMAKQVQRRDAKLKELSAGVAHEIRNPLNSIKLLITLLGEELADQSSDVHLKTIDTLHHEIGKLNGFLTEFLTYSRPVTLVRDFVDPDEIVQAAVDMAVAETRDKNVTITVISNGPFPALHVDRNRMEQSLLNILLNAIHASDCEGRVVLEVSRSADKKCIEFAVSDSGPGIPGEAKAHLFEPFFTTKATGTGLGLSNAENIVRGHGGEIQVDNIAKGGARFTVILPLQNPNPKEQ